MRVFLTRCTLVWILWHYFLSVILLISNQCSRFFPMFPHSCARASNAKCDFDLASPSTQITQITLDFLRFRSVYFCLFFFFPFTFHEFHASVIFKISYPNIPIAPNSHSFFFFFRKILPSVNFTFHEISPKITRETGKRGCKELQKEATLSCKKFLFP